MMPALTSSSLYLPMSARSFSLGMTPASEFFVPFTITMTLIVVLLRSSSALCLASERASIERSLDRHPAPNFFLSIDASQKQQVFSAVCDEKKCGRATDEISARLGFDFETVAHGDGHGSRSR